MNEGTPVAVCSSSVGLPRRETVTVRSFLLGLSSSGVENLCLLPDSEFSMYRAPVFDLCPELEQQTKFKDVDFILYFGIKSLENSI